MMRDRKDKLALLKESAKSMGSVAIAFSGGVDSTFLLKVFSDALGDKAVAITAVAASFSEDETTAAEDFCRSNGIRHFKVDIGWNDMDAFSHNPPDRCYICKKIIFGKLKEMARAQGIQAVVDGTNLSDSADYRPGAAALSELGIRSPLKEAGLTKDEIRSHLRDMGLAVWNKPAYACLASRIPYGEPITVDKLRQIDMLESELRGIGLVQVRVRHHGDVARIEVDPAERTIFFNLDFMDKVNEMAKSAGFAYGALDLGGYRTGSMNETLPICNKRSEAE